MTYIVKTECRACGLNDLEQFIDLTDQPLANNYTETSVEQPTYPLAVNVCRDCFHTQLTVVVDPDEMFKNYLYVSGTSQTLRDYFKAFAERTSEIWQNVSGSPTGRVLDIACNDGSQLDAFKELGWKTYGVDPAENLVPVAKAKGHTIYKDYWNAKLALAIKHSPEAPDDFDVITAQNVFAHTDDILGFLLACREVMHPESIIMIQTSQANMYPNGEFDTIYHEHLSFFNTNSMLTLCDRAKLHLQYVEKEDIHGTSYVFMIGLKHFRGSNVGNALAQESKIGLYKVETYHEFASRALATIEHLQKAVNAARSDGFMVVGYGAAAKGMTVLNYGKIQLDFIIDDSPLKQGKFTPGMRIPIYNAEYLATIGPEQKIAFVPLAWNFFTEIKTRIRKQRTNEHDLFIKYFPALEIFQ